MNMEQQPASGTERELSPAMPETGEHPWQYQPHIYVADLASLKRGIQHGLWIDADQAPNDLDADIAAILDSSPTGGDGGWAIHDGHDFAGMAVAGLTDTALISRLARGVVERGEAFAAYVGWLGTAAQQLDSFNDDYLGTYPTLEDWGRTAVRELGWPEQITQRLAPEMACYIQINYGAWVEDNSRDVHVVHGNEGIHVFR